MDMEDMRDANQPSEQNSLIGSWWPSDFAESFGSISLESRNENLRRKEYNNKEKYDRLSYKRASQILWSTGMLSEPIPNGFYSAVPDKKLKELYEDIPTLEELNALEHEGLRADVILVDAEKDKKLSMLKQLIVALVKGLNSNAAAVIKKIAGLVSDFYKRSNSEISPKKAAQEESSHLSESRGVQLLGQIRHATCRPRAILFKVLADAVGLESRLVVGLPTEGTSECVDSHKHMSVSVVLNSVELVVDLMRFPGQLMPRSTKAIFMSHISAAGESDSAENDSCDSPMEPNSPLYGVSERLDPERTEKDDGLLYQRRLEAYSNAAGPSLRNMMLRSNSVDRKLSLSRSEPNIAATFWRRSRRKVIAEQRTASSSPEHPSLRSRGRSMLSGDNKSFREYSVDDGTSRSEGASSPDTRRLRRRSISMTPEIGDDIVRAVRAMNESLKQNRLLREQGGSGSSNSGQPEEVNDTQPDDRSKLYDNNSTIYVTQGQHSSQKAMSLPSSPHEFRSQTPEHSGIPRVNEEMVSTWNRVLDSPMFQNKPLLPYDEWNIDFSELTVGTRVGIG
ncbi:serine/threonine-protein kinase EDR1-like [Salvia splendens]|uniref:serine/threonine-protein kinase EDR1-like n=1 Tax=Salvia splendens TaxID=180675 RepID=UPI001102D3E3|nr:serine/threonine-protein kinase EDR1-like [Salvia splendens]